MEQGFPRIEPEVVQVGAGVTATEITLGGVPRGAIIVLCDAGRLSDAAEPMNGLAEHGYESVAAEVSGGAGDVVGSLLAHLGARGWEAEQVGVIGYGAGGRAALLTAAEFTLGAAVTIAPDGPVSDPREPLRTPWLGLFGGDAAGLRRLGETLYERSPVYTEVVCYPAAGSGFHRDSAEAPVHAAAFDSWQRTVEWLNLRVVPRLTPLARAWRARQPAGVGIP